MDAGDVVKFVDEKLLGADVFELLMQVLDEHLEGEEVGLVHAEEGVFLDETGLDFLKLDDLAHAINN